MQQLFDKEHKNPQKHITYDVPSYSNDFRTKYKHML